MGLTAILCSAAIVLLADTSSSVEDVHYHMMRDGHASAFEAPEVVSAIQRSDGIAVLYTEFATGTRNRIGWRILRTEADSRAYAAEVRSLNRIHTGMTATGTALEHALTMLTAPPCETETRIIDIVTDGQSNSGPIPEHSRDRAVREGVRINGLGVFTSIHHADPAGWLEQHVITPQIAMEDGRIIPQGFAIVISSWADFAQAIRVKISLEFTEVPTTLKRFAELLWRHG